MQTMGVWAELAGKETNVDKENMKIPRQTSKMRSRGLVRGSVLLDERFHREDVVALAHCPRYALMIGARNANKLFRRIRVVEDDSSVLVDVDEFVIHTMHQKEGRVHPSDLFGIVVFPIRDVRTGNVQQHTGLKKSRH